MNIGAYNHTCAVVGESHCGCRKLIRQFTSRTGQIERIQDSPFRDDLTGALLYSSMLFNITIHYVDSDHYDQYQEKLYESTDFVIFMFSLTSRSSLRAIIDKFAQDLFYTSFSANIILVACDGYLRTTSPDLVRVTRQEVQDVGADISAFNIIELQTIDPTSVSRVFESAVASLYPSLHARYLRHKRDFDCVGVILPLGKEEICRRDVIKKVGHWRVLMTTDTEGLRVATKSMFTAPVVLILEFDTKYPEELCGTIEANRELIMKHWNLPIIFAGHGKQFDIGKKWIQQTGKGITGYLAHERYRKAGAFAKHVAKVTEKICGNGKHRRRTF